MAEGKKSFVLYCDLMQNIDHLTFEEKGKLFTHLLEYVNDKNPKFEDDERLLITAWKPIEMQLKRDLKKFETVKEKRSEAGKASAKARAKKQSSTKSTSVKSVEQCSTNSTDNVNDNVNDNVINNKENFFDFNSVFKSPDDVLKIVGDKYEHIMIYNDVQQYAFKQSITTTKAKWKTLIKNWATRNGNKYERQPLPRYLRDKL